MTDRRHCDGPTCEVNISNDEYASALSMTWESFITLERRGHSDLHFCSQTCLTNWTNKETTVRASH